MLLWLTEILSQYFSSLTVFQYLTLRAILGILTALLISLVIGPVMIRKLSQYQIGQAVRDDGPQTHLSKAGTPTMGGALILVAIAISTLLWADLTNRYVWVVLLVTLLFGAIGWVDDYRKVVERNPRGLPARWKYFWQSVIGATAAIVLYVTASMPQETSLYLPFLKNVSLTLGPVLFILLTYFVIVGSSNAVNLTDGLDGLAIGPVIIAATTYMIFAYVAGHIKIANYLQINYVVGSGEVAILCGTLAGAGMGFLWFNAYPAQIFMGDVGSLSLGAGLGTIAVITKQEILLVLVGGLFVVEALSVIFQVGFFKMTSGRRIFRMAPLHHHFELKGWPEPKVIVRFWIIAIALALLAMSTLKLR